MDEMIKFVKSCECIGIHHKKRFKLRRNQGLGNPAFINEIFEEAQDIGKDLVY